MAFVGIRTLSRDTSRVIKEFEETGEPVILTREGKPIGALVPVDERQVEELVLTTASEFRAAPDDETGGEIVSLGEIAARRGLELDEERQALAAPVDEELHELAGDAAEQEVKAVVDLLNEEVAEGVMTAARVEFGTVYDEIVAGLEGEQLDSGEARELTEAAAALYGRALRRKLFPVLGSMGARRQATSPLAIYEISRSVNRSTGDLVRGINRSIDLGRRASALEVTATLRAFGRAWDAEAEGDREETVATAELDTMP
jgi:prevent-host-death family protein